MLSLEPRLRAAGNGVTLLCFGAHCDDIEIGCGGTLLRWLSQRPDWNVWWVVLTSTAEREREARNAADKLLLAAATRNIVIKNFRDGFLPYNGADVKQCFEDIKKQVKPDVILTHHRHDLHQDHRIVSELTWNTFRDHFILEYEIPKYDGDLGTPNCFVPLSNAHWQQKIEILTSCYPSQREKAWFAPETFAAIMRLRGMECNSKSGYAEAFFSHKFVL